MDDDEFVHRKLVKRRVLRPKMPKFESVGSVAVTYLSSLRGNRLLHFMGHRYIKNNVHGANIYWKCTKWHNGCKARAITNSSVSDSCTVKNVHNHPAILSELCWATYQSHLCTKRQQLQPIRQWINSNSNLLYFDCFRNLTLHFSLKSNKTRLFVIVFLHKSFTRNPFVYLYVGN